jgi:hypothetical protein
MRQKLFWVTAGDHRPRLGVEKYAVVAGEMLINRA